MRPQRLEVEGFGTFREPTVVDFADIDLAALVGPTGSGKSTVIDALTFALYGSVARYDNPARVAPIIHQLATEARVRLDFELAGRSYIAVRIVRRAKSDRRGTLRASTKEARLEVVEVDGGTTVLAGNVTELDQQVHDLVGLDFAQFTRTIVLPQGEFAELLTDDPSTRQTLIRRLLELDIYARMGGLARERAAAAQQNAGVYQHELSRLDGVTGERLAAAGARIDALDQFSAGAADRLGELAEVDADLARKGDAAERIDRELAAVGQVAVPEGLHEASDGIEQARSRLDAAERARRDAAGERDRAGDALEAAGDPLEIQRLLHRRQRLTELGLAMSGIETDLAKARAEQQRAAEALAGAEHEASVAVEALRAARSGVDAAPWIAQLRAGEPCPICHQPVATVPQPATGGELQAAENEAEAQANRCQQALSAAMSAAARAGGRVEAVQADLAKRASEAGDLEASLDGVDGTEALTAAAERAAGAAEVVKRAGVVLRAAEAEVDEAAEQLGRAEQAERRFRQALGERRDVVAEYRPPSPDGRSLVADWEALARWAAERADALAAERAGIDEACRRLGAARVAIIEELALSAGALDLDPDPGRLLVTVAAARAAAEAEVARISEQLEHKQELATTLDTLRQREQVYGSLGRQHLSASGFERWLLVEALEAIVERATARLLQLSSGQYSLEARNGSFQVRDHGNADERRDIRTLSGGEIFLASLALALALSESIAELASVDAPRLESIFLDEGFGSLDADTLDIVAGAIEELSATGRLVVLVTHVRDLAERMPVRFEVSKGPSTSTVERVQL